MLLFCCEPSRRVLRKTAEDIIFPRRFSPLFFCFSKRSLKKHRMSSSLCKLLCSSIANVKMWRSFKVPLITISLLFVAHLFVLLFFLSDGSIVSYFRKDKLEIEKFWRKRSLKQKKNCLFQQSASFIDLSNGQLCPVYRWSKWPPSERL